VKQNQFLFSSRAMISIVIPAFNEEKRLPPLLEQLRLLHVHPKDIELVVVDDGSSDRTAEISQNAIDLFFPLGKVVKMQTNGGKGSALRSGVAVASAPVIITMDADMATDLVAVEIALAALGETHIVIGSRVTEGSITQGVSRLRKIITKGFSLFLYVVTKRKVSDTQCGFKAYQGPVAKILFATSVVNGFAQDAEILDLAYRNGLSIKEIPVEWRAMPGSKVKIIRDSLYSFFEFLRYRTNLRNLSLIEGFTITAGDGQIGSQQERLSFFPSESIFIKRDSGIEVLIAGIGSEKIMQIADNYQSRFPNHQILHSTYEIGNILELLHWD
jgi:glycosyltransferase involved in cell wall biosynthesis